MITYAEFFAGVGGFRLGLEGLTPREASVEEGKAQFKCVFANDFDVHCEQTYNVNFDNPKLTCCDIHKLEAKNIPDVDLFVGGFPCTPYSIAGAKKGFEDPRSDCLFKFLSLVQEKRPRMVLMENVKNLVSHDGGATIATIQNRFKEMGYSIKYKVLDTCQITRIPQHRERVFIFGSTDPTLVERFTFPMETPADKLKVTDLLETIVNPKYYYTVKSAIYPALQKEVTEVGSVYQYRRTYVRKNQSQVCPTLTANMGTGGHNVPIIREVSGQIRKLTPRECFRLQGFPETYRFPAKLADGHTYHQSGNAVTVPVIESIGKEILKAFAK